MSDFKRRLKRYVRQKRFDRAREFVQAVMPPNKDAYLERIDELEVRAEYGKPMTDTRLHGDALVVDQSVGWLKNENNIGNSKHHPKNPIQFLSDKTLKRHDNVIYATLFGLQASALATNFAKLDQRGLFVITMTIYILLRIAQFAALIAFIVFFFREATILTLAPIGLMILLPIGYPGLLARLQQPFYNQWLIDHAKMLHQSNDL